MVTTEQVLEKLETKHIIQILDEHYIEYKDENNPKHIQCKTVCHGGNSYKLWYLKQEKFFYCFTECGGMSVFDLLITINGWSFSQALSYVANKVGISINYNKPKAFGTAKKKINDWDFINKYRKNKNRVKVEHYLPKYDKNILKVFDNIYPSSWEDEYITTDSMRKFGICFHTSEFATIIPHYGLNGDLVGIRSRHHLQQHIDSGRKYMPTILENKMYAHPLQFNLYGAYQNKETIKKKKKVLLVESEKSILQCESYYPNDNFSVAQCGSNLSNSQRDILIYDLEVDEVIIGLDKQYQTIGKYDNEGNFIEDKEHAEYVKKVKKIADKLVNYVNVYIIYCVDSRLDYKSSPTDHGKEILEQLMKEKIRYYKNEENE